MGEAKYRQANDPAFGKIPNRNTMRGLIISCPLTINGSTIQGTTNLDPQDLRFALFFWDRLAWPTSRGIHFGSSGDAAFLESSGILSRPEYTYNGDQAKAIIRGQLAALEDFEKNAPGAWAIGQGTNSIFHDSEIITPNAGTLLELQRAIPIPKGDIPLNDILQFRHRRRDELLLFRTHLESLVKELEKSSDSVDSLNRIKSELDQACANIVRTTREWQLPLQLTNFSASFNYDLSNAFSAATKTWISSETLGLPITASVIATTMAGINSQLKITHGLKIRSPRKATSPFKYAYSIQREFTR